MKRQQTIPSAGSKSHGFTLVEMAVVVAIIALMISGLMVPAAVLMDQKKYAETNDALAAAREAVVGFAAINRRLPCPDRTGTGVENCAAAQDPGHAWGELPFTTLGVHGFDAWGNRLRYSVFPALMAANGLTVAPAAAQLSVRCSSVVAALGTPGHIPGCHNAAGAPMNLTTGASFLVISSGTNSFGAVSASGTAFPAPTSPDEIDNHPGLGANAVTRSQFVSRIRTDIGTPAGEFDDVLVWMSVSQLMARMQQARVWP